jgi:hypothetical protein
MRRIDIEHERLISLLFDFWHDSRSIIVLRILLAAINAKQEETR